MKRATPILFAALALASASALSQKTPAKRVIGYFVSWGVYLRNYHVANIPATQVTHINYAFAKIVNGRIALGDPYADTQKFYPGDSWKPGTLRGCFHQLQILKKKHPHLKVLISIGGWTWSGRFSDAVLTSASRKTFARSIVDFVVRYGFDGADIDWEYPGGGGKPGNISRPQDPKNFTLFLSELRKQFTAKSQVTGKKYLLTIAASADARKIARLEVAKIHPLLDWINLMSYDFHGPWKGVPDPVTNFNTPLYAVKGDPCPAPFNTTFNVSRAVEEYLKRGVPREKLNVGLAFYGRGFGGATGGKNGLYAKYTGPAPMGTWERGVFDYTDLKKNYIGKAGFRVFRHPGARVPWIYNPSRQVMISYDDPRSITEKAWFVQARGLGGIMFWEFSCDRDRDLLSPVSRILRGKAELWSPLAKVSLAKPASPAFHIEGGTWRAGRTYILLGSARGSFPGTPLPGGILPLNLDNFTWWALSNPAFFSGAVGVLDQKGAAQAVLNLRGLALPPALAGTYLTFSAWTLKNPAGLDGEESNALDIFFIP